MTKNLKNAGCAVLALAVVVLAGCGGGNEGAESAAAMVQRVEGRSMPESVTPTLSAIKSREAMAVPVATPIYLGPLEQSKTLGLDVPGPQLIGVGRAIVATSTSDQLKQQFRWSRTLTGAPVAAVSFTAQDAKGVRLGVLVDALPEGAVLRIYSQKRPQSVYQVTGAELLQRIQLNLNAGDSSSEARTWWTPEFGSEEVTMEVELPAQTDIAALKIAVPRLSHIFAELALPSEQEMLSKINDSDACQLDATCNDVYSNQRNAVARMLFNNGGSTYLCTGTLLNDASNSGTPYFLSANHCISSQTVASTMQTDWFYRSPSCNSRTLSSASTKLYNGAMLLHASSGTDITLMRLKDAPPAGAFFAGWDAATDTSGGSVAVTGLHHPRGDLLKISLGSVQGQTACTTIGGAQFSCSGTSGNFYRVGWTQGTTEGGSSGSALFSGSGHHVIGTLYGGTASCTASTSVDVYGRFDIAYSENLSQWLGGTDGNNDISRALENILRVLRTTAAQ